MTTATTAAAATTAGVYVHLPFCPYVCPYCDFAKWAWDDARAERYVRALHAEIDAAPAVAARTLFFGGGTPTIYGVDEIAAIVARVRARFALPGDAEVTAEANPDPSLSAKIAGLAGAGVNRLSIGVQSFDARELRVLGRRHTADDVRRAVAAARSAGIASISLDLIFGVPGQSVADWGRSLDAALALDVDHLSCYGLTVEEGTPYATWFARDPSAFPDDTREAELYALAIARLGAAGYEHYEISNWARPAHRSRHNAIYWRNDPYLGLGVSAASYLGGVRSTHARDLEVYCTAALAGTPIPGDAERLEGAAQAGEAIMLALRTAEGVESVAFRERYGLDVEERYGTTIDELAAAGLLERAGAGIRLTTRGRFVANDVCSAFLAD